MPNSYYELHQSLSQERLTHQWDWFSGSQLKTTWNFDILSGSGTATDSDAQNGGVILTSGTSGTQWLSINHNGIDHYSETGSVCISRFKRNTATTLVYAGLKNDAGASDNANMFGFTSDDLSPRTFFDVRANGIDTNTSVTLDTDYHRFVTELRSSSGIGWVDGVLENVITSNLPTSILEPHLNIYAISPSGAKTANITFMEAYNT